MSRRLLLGGARSATVCVVACRAACRERSRATSAPLSRQRCACCRRTLALPFHLPGGHLRPAPGDDSDDAVSVGGVALSLAGAAPDVVITKLFLERGLG